MPQIKSGRFIVTLEIDAWYQDDMSTLVARIEEEAKRMKDPLGRRHDKTASISDVEVLGITRKKRSEW